MSFTLPTQLSLSVICQSDTLEVATYFTKGGSVSPLLCSLLQRLHDSDNKMLHLDGSNNKAMEVTRNFSHLLRNNDDDDGSSI